jgi:hypothetical protein
MLSEYPLRVHVSKGLQDCFNHEWITQASTAKSVMFREHRQSLRNLLRAVAGEVTGAGGLERILLDPDGHHKVLKGQYLDHAANKSRQESNISAVYEMLPAKVTKDLRAKRVSRADRVDIISKLAPLLLGKELYRKHVSVNKIWSFIKTKPMLLREYYSVVWLAIDWIGAGGIEGAAREKITNDLIDHEYVITATCFDGIVSGEGRVRDAYADFMMLLSKPVPHPSEYAENLFA